MPLDATTAHLLPEHVDLSVILTMAGLGAFGATCIGALRQFDAERLRRIALFGSMVGGAIGVGCWVLALLQAIP